MTKYHLPILRSLQCQGILLIVIACFFWEYKSVLTGYSVFLGGFTCFFPSVCFYRCFFKNGQVRPARAVLASFLIGELIKIFFTGILFTCALKWAKLLALPFFMAFVAMQLLHWGITLLFQSKGKLAS